MLMRTQNNWNFTHKQFVVYYQVKYVLIIWPSFPFLGVYQREMKNYIHTRAYTQMFIVTLFIITWKQPKYFSMSEWRNKLWSIHTMKNSSAIKRTDE